jgi:hypothetical protein
MIFVALGFILVLIGTQILSRAKVVNPEDSAPKLSPFHPLIVLIEAIASLLIFGGLAMCVAMPNDLPFAYRAWTGSAGSLMAILGACIFIFGYISHSESKPREAGLITFLGAPICFGGKPVVVGGVVFVIPFLMGSIKVIMDNYDHVVKMTVISKGDPDSKVLGGKTAIPIDGEVIETVRPAIDDLFDFNAAGNDTKAVASQLDGAVIAETRDITKIMNPFQIAQEGSSINRILEERIKNDLFNRKKVGLELVLVKSNFPLPENIKTAMKEVMAEDFQRESVKRDSASMTDAAKDMQREDAIQYMTTINGKSLKDLSPEEVIEVDKAICRPGGLLDQKKVKPHDDYRAAAERRRMIKDGNVKENKFKVEGLPPGSHFYVGNFEQGRTQTR